MMLSGVRGPRGQPVCVVTVASGEQSGHLDHALTRLADYTEKQHELRRKVKQALVYPSMMALVACSVIVFLVLYVVPKIISAFQESTCLVCAGNHSEHTSSK